MLNGNKGSYSGKKVEECLMFSQFVRNINTYGFLVERRGHKINSLKLLFKDIISVLYITVT